MALRYKCTECSAGAKILDVKYILSANVRRRWIQCQQCSHKWIADEPLGEPHERIRTRITDEVITEILLSSETLGQIQKRLGIHGTTVSAIRLGKLHGHRVPGVPRWNAKRSCSDCQHWRLGDDETPSRCWFGFPDPIEEGVFAARWCNLYQEEPCASS